MGFEIHLTESHQSGFELDYLSKAITGKRLSLFGEELEEFGEKLIKLTNRKHIALLNSGSSAIHLALKVLDVTQGDTILCQSNTFVATTSPAIYLGATPIFIDSERDTWNMDPNILEETLKGLDMSAHKQLPKAIMPVHLYGMPAKMDEINSIASKYDIPVIEDAAEALGSNLDGKAAGSMGVMSILSFNGNKIITTSGGGALLSNNKEYIDYAHFLATQARDSAPHYQHSEIGYNYRMGNLNAAVGLGQLVALEERIHRKREIFDFYNDKLKSTDSIEFLEEPEGFFSNRWLTTILTNSYEKRELLREALLRMNIESRPLWKPMHMQPVFNDAPYFGGKISEDLFNRGLCLPSGTTLKENDLQRVVDVICLTLNKDKDKS